MLFSKKSALLLSVALFISALGACSSSVVSTVSLNGDANFANSNLVNKISERISQSKLDPNHFYIDAGNGEKTGASLSVKVNFGNGTFKTKSTDGSTAKIISDVTGFDVALVESTTGTPPSGTGVALTGLTGGTLIAAGNLTRTMVTGTASSNGLFPADGGTGAVGINATTGIVTFVNVPQNSGVVNTKRYYVIAAAKDTGGLNITNAAGPINALATVAFVGAGTPAPAAITLVAGRYYISTTGGDTVTVGALGSEGVTKQVVTGKAVYHIFSAGADLGIPLVLSDTSTGANVTSEIKVNDGTTAPIVTPITVS
jgi:hypothetical protein